jgi:hypothetical protein
MATATRTTSKLEDIPLDRHSNLETWVRGWHNRLRNQAYAIELGAAELQGFLGRAKGLEKFAARQKARRVARRFKRAARLSEAAASEFSRGMTAYRREYPELISPRKSGKAGGFNFNS